MLKKYVTYVGGALRTSDTIEGLVTRYPQQTLEIHETSLVGYYRRKIEIVKIEKIEKPSHLKRKYDPALDDDEADDEDSL